MQTEQDNTSLIKEISSLEWYHTIDFGNGLVTPGHYDHRPYLKYYGIPEDLRGKRVIDIGAASGFFSFEFERRGASVLATDLPEWFDHDFGPNYLPDKNADQGRTYLHRPFELARQILGSKVERKKINIYDISPETVGMFDIAFCGSVLLHLTDPIKALRRIASITKEFAIIATAIDPRNSSLPLATFFGHYRGDAWWIPTRACLELMAASAGFVGIAWVSDFRLDYRDGTQATYHGVLHAYKSTSNWNSNVKHKDEVIKDYIASSSIEDQEQLKQEIADLRQKIRACEDDPLFRIAARLRRVFGRLP